MCHSSAKSFSGNFFAGDRFNYSRSCKEHLGCTFNHVDEVGQCRGVYSAACRWSHDSGNLRNNAGCNGIAPEDFAVAGKCVYCFLDTSSAGVVQAYARSTYLESQFVYVNDFSCMHFAQGSAFYCEVLCKCKYESAVNSTITCNNTFARKIFLFLAEVVATGFNERVDFYERAFIKEKSKSFTSSQLAFFVLFCNTFFTTHSLNVSEVLMEKFNSFCNSCHSYTSKNIGPFTGTSLL